MKSKSLHKIIFFIIAPLTMLTILLLFITLSSTMKFSNKDIQQQDMFILSTANDTIIDQHDMDVEYMNFKIYEMIIVEKSNQNLINSTEDSNETSLWNGESDLPKTNNLKIENEQLNAGFAYQIKNTDWQKFKFNFSINFKRMMVLSFSEVFDNQKQ